MAIGGARPRGRAHVSSRCRTDFGSDGRSSDKWYLARISQSFERSLVHVVKDMSDGKVTCHPNATVAAIYGIKIGIIELMHLALLLSIKIQCFGPQTKTSHA